MKTTSIDNEKAKQINTLGKKPGASLFTRCTMAAAVAATLVTSPVSVAGTLEVVVVTAQKRSDTLQETPISMQAFPESELEKRSAGDISKLAEFTPNVQFDFTAPVSGSSNAAVIFVRGIGQTDFGLTAESGVGVYLDDIYIARSMGGVLDLMDVERVEVLRGPQGTLFGKNTVGGAISVTSKEPWEEFEGAVNVTVGNDSRRDVKLSVNVPLVEDKLFLRMGGVSKTRDGYGKRLQTGETMGDVNSDTFKAALRWVATDNLEFTWNFDSTRADEDLPTTSLLKAEPAGSLSDLYNLYVANGWITGGQIWSSAVIDGDNYNSNGTAPVGSELDVDGTSLVAEWDHDDWSVKSVTGYRETESSFGRDADHSPSAIMHTANEIELEQFSQEFNFSGSALDENLDWLVGLYYFNEEGKDVPNITILPEIFQADAACAATNCSGAGFGLGYRANQPLPLSIGGSIEIENESRAIFTHGTYRFTDELSMTYGIRYTEEEKKSFMPLVLADINFPLFNNPRSEQTFYNVSPRIGLEYSWTVDMFTYASYSEGFKSGGVVSRYIAPRDTLIPFEPEEVKNYEVGFKSEWMNGQFRINGAAFFTEYTDVQITVFNGIVPEIRNAAEGEVQGLELEFTGLLTDDLLLTSSIGYLDAQYTELDETTGGSLEITKDHDFVNSPEWSGSVALEYTHQLGDLGELMARVDYSYRSEVAKDAANTPELTQDSYGLVSANIMFTSADEHWQVSVFGTNLADEEYVASGVSTTSFGIVEGTYGRPREVGLNVKYSF